ncbi:nucleotide-diphospho-sugar transferase, partial [Metschnikowia bicuspidata var. bicuspidata NRRL YB-4993]
AFLKKIEEQVRDEYTDGFTEALRNEIRQKMVREATERKFTSDVKSYKIAEELKAQYLKNNEQPLKDELVKEFLLETSDENLRTKIKQMESLSIDRGTYFENIFEHILSDFSPSGRGVAQKGQTVPLNGLREVTVPPKSRKELSDGRVSISAEDFTDLQAKHDGFVAFLRSLSVPPTEIFSGSGVVLSAGKKHILGALNVIIQIREMGSELPIELVLDVKTDYNKRICEVVLPRFDAKCLVMEEVLGLEAYGKSKRDGFPMKSMALILSSFDNTIYLDSDNFPIKNVDELLESEPYLQTRFLLWPDNWHKGVSPTFYDIVRLSAGEPIRRDGFSNEGDFSSYLSRKRDLEILLHDLEGLPPFASVESGQLVFSKREHFRSLFLTLYYNLHGEKYYYPLIYQGVFGSGDRETFVPALHVMNEPYYLTDWRMKFSGVRREKVNKPGSFFFDESTMVQSDPASAQAFHKRWRSWLSKQGLDSRLDPFQNGDYTLNLWRRFFEENSEMSEPEAYFLHVHSPKISSVYNEKSSKARYNYQDRYIRELGEEGKADGLGPTDWELKFQAINTWSTCEGMTDDEYWASYQLDQKDVCKKMMDYVEILKGNS